MIELLTDIDFYILLLKIFWMDFIPQFIPIFIIIFLATILFNYRNIKSVDGNLIKENIRTVFWKSLISVAFVTCLLQCSGKSSLN